MSRLLLAVVGTLGLAALAADATAQVPVTTYYAPAPVTSYYAPPVGYYGATTSYYAPVAPSAIVAGRRTAYYPATGAVYAAPRAYSYYPTTAAYAPVRGAPVTSYYAPAVGYPAAVGFYSPYGGPEIRVPGQPIRNTLRAILP